MPRLSRWFAAFAVVMVSLVAALSRWRADDGRTVTGEQVVKRGAASVRDGAALAVPERLSSTTAAQDARLRSVYASSVSAGGSSPMPSGLSGQSPSTVSSSLNATAVADGAGAKRGAAGTPRPCTNDGQCPEGSGCFFDDVQSKLYCAPGDCTSDADCEETKACRTFTSGQFGRSLRRCLPAGELRVDARCDMMSSAPAQTCEKGLLCVNGRCGASCDPSTPNACGAGRACVRSRDGNGCFPNCKEHACSGGQVCVDLGGYGDCFEKAGEDCREKGCAQGEVCQLDLSQGRAAFWCARPCDSLRAGSCGKGYVCGAASGNGSICYQSCRLGFDEEDCPSGQVCSTVNEEMTETGCHP